MSLNTVDIGMEECLVTPEGYDLSNNPLIQEMIEDPRLLFGNFPQFEEGNQSYGVFDISDVADRPLVAKYAWNTRQQLETMCRIRKLDLPFTAARPYLASYKVLISERMPEERHLPKVLDIEIDVNNAWPIGKQISELYDSMKIYEKTGIKVDYAPQNWFVVGDIPERNGLDWRKYLPLLKLCNVDP